MKLTNTQVNVLVRTIWAKIEAKIESLKTTSEYNTALNAEKAKIKYDEKLDYINKVKKLNEQKIKITDKIEDLNEEYYIKFAPKGSSRYGNTVPNSVNSLDKIVSAKTIEIIATDIPTKEEIEADIILTAMSPGANDIISSLTTKYSL